MEVRDARWRRRSVEDESGAEVVALRREEEGLASAPAESDDGEFVAGRGELERVVGGGVEIGVDGVGIETGDGFDGCLLVGEGTGAAGVRSEAGEEVGGDDDVAHGGDVVSHAACPVGEAEDLVDEQDDGRLVADFGIDDEGVDGAAAVGDLDPFLVAWGLVEEGFRPVLRGGGRGESERGEEEQDCGDEAGKRVFHGGSIAEEQGPGIRE